MTPSVFYQGGTLVLKDPDPALTPPAPFEWIKEHWRCEGYHYPALGEWFRAQGFRDTVPRWQHLDLALHDTRQPHAYQQAALDAWEQAGAGAASCCPPARARHVGRNGVAGIEHRPK